MEGKRRGREGQPPKYFGLEPPLPGGRNICRHCPPPLRYATLLCFVESCIWYAGHGHSEAID